LGNFSPVSACTSGALADVASAATGDASLGSYGTAGGTANQAVHFLLRPHAVLTISGHCSCSQQGPAHRLRTTRPPVLPM
jgi:hypothetical protein